MSDRYRELSAFIAVAEAGAFNAAARKLGLSPSAATRLVGALEARLGTRLLTRTTRRATPTEAGARLLADGAAALAALDAAEAVARGAQEVPSGLLRVTAPVLFGERHVAPALRALIDAHPALTAEALFLDRVVDLVEEGVDVAVRIGPLAESSLVARRIGAVRPVLVAAPAYLAKWGAPASLDDLAAHRLVYMSAARGAPEWRFEAAGRRRVLKLTPALSTTSNAAAIDAALAGWGVARALSYQVAQALADGRLVELLADADDRASPIHLVHAHGRRASAKMRAFIGAMVDQAKTAAFDADPSLSNQGPAAM